MKCAFGRTKLVAFQKSPLKQRARLPSCNNADPTTIDGRAHTSYALSYRIQADPFGPGPLEGYLGLDPYFKSWDSLGYFPNNGHSFHTPKLYSRGRWRVDIRLQTFYDVQTDPANPGHDHLYIDLFRYNNNTGGSLELALVTGGHQTNMIPGNPPPNENSVDLSVNPALMTDPSAVNTTWKFDLSTGPMDVTDYIVIGEVESYCHPVFYIDWTYLTGIITFTSGGGRVQLNSGSPEPGDWIIPVPLSASLILGQIDLTFTRIPILEAAFKFQKLSGLNYRFTSISLGSPTTYDWDWGDGSPHGSGAVADHSFPGAGTYNVKLTIGNAYGDIAEHTLQFVLTVQAAFTFTPGTYPNVAFDASTSHNAATFDWNFGDGSAHGTTVNPTHTFSNPGIYTVTLTVGDGFGHSDSISHVVVIGPTLSANFSSAGVASPPHTVQFTDTSTGTIQSWAWQFRETPTLITTSALQSPLHTFVNAGAHLTTLTITDVYGFTSSVTHGIPVP